MQTGSIKISELNPFTSSILTEDFIPVVDSSSMTTFRVGLGQLFGSSFSGVSASLFASRSVTSTSSSWASSSVSASYALNSSQSLVANRVNLSQQLSYIPQWNGNSANSNLSTYETQMVYTQSRLVLDYDHVSSTVAWYATASNYLDGLTPSNGGWYRNGGIYAIYPIIGAAFLGADQKAWAYGTSSLYNANTFYSGSGAWITIPTGSGALSSSLNNRWVRIAAVSFGTELRPAAFAQSMRAMMGTIRIDARTTVAGTNAQNCVEFDMWQQLWSGVIKADVKYSDNYGPKIVDKIRVCRTVASGTLYDPHMYIDLHVNNLNANDIDLYLGLKSLGGSSVRFLEQPTWSPVEPVNTGSLAAGPSRLEFVPNIGSYYWIYDNDVAPACRDYIISGQRVRIDPRNSTIADTRRANYDLEVSGTIGANSFYVKDLPGKDGTFVVYEPSSATWLYQRFLKGLMIDSGSASAPGTGSVTILGNNPVGTIIDWAGYNSSSLSSSGWFMCDGQWFSSGSFPAAYTALGGTNNPWGDGSPGSGWNGGTGKFKIPDLCKRGTVGSSLGGAAITNYKVRIGDTGGNEDYMTNHFHYFGTTIGTTAIFQWINGTSEVNTAGTTMDLSRTVKGGVTQYSTHGGTSGGWQGSKSWRDNLVNLGHKWQLVTSYAYLDGGSSSEQVPPYAVVFKLIRLL